MARKKRSPLSPEILAVLRRSAKLEPCQKFRREPEVEEFFAHISQDKCEQCLDFFDELIRRIDDDDDVAAGEELGTRFNSSRIPQPSTHPPRLSAP